MPTVEKYGGSPPWKPKSRTSSIAAVSFCMLALLALIDLTFSSLVANDTHDAVGVEIRI